MKKKLDIVFYVVILGVLAMRAPLIISQFKSEGTTVSTVTLQTSDMQPVTFPRPNEKSVVIFWATWCAPCTVELNRINKSILDKEIDPRFIYVVNMGEDPDMVRVEFARRQYKFQSYFNFNKNLADQLKVEVTPTVAFINEKQKLEWISSGISPTLIYRVQKFLE